jgi:O-antigen ligase
VGRRWPPPSRGARDRRVRTSLPAAEEVDSSGGILLSAPLRTAHHLPILQGGRRQLAALAAVALTVVAGLGSTNESTLLFRLVAAAVLIVVCFRWLLAGTLLFVFLTFPAQLPGSIGVGATLAKPLGIVLVLSWLMALLSDPRRPILFRDNPLLAALVVGYVAWAILSLLWSSYSGDTTYDLKRLILAVVLLAVLYSVAGNRRDFLILLWGYVIASATTSIYVLASGTTLEGRLTGGLNDPNYLASELVLAIILAGFLLGSTSRRSLRAVLVAAAGIDIAVFVLTQSRGGIIGLATGAVVAIIVAGRTRTMVLAVSALATGLVIGWIAIFASSGLRHRVTDFSSQATSGRADSWQIAWKIAKAHPINGIALGNYRDEQLKYAASSIDIQHITYIVHDQLIVHNTYLETLAELGIVGFLLLGGAMVVCGSSAVRAIRLALQTDDHAFANALRGLVAGSCGLFTAYIFVSAEYEKQLWFALALLAVSSVVVSRQAEAAGHPEPEDTANVARLRPVASASAPR